MPFKNTAGPESAYPEPPSAAGSRTRPPEAFRDPSEHILSGKGSTLQHARSVYSHGPVEVLPGLFLGDEHNARDHQMLSTLGITTILNVAKETVLEFQSECSCNPARPDTSHPVWPIAANRIAHSDARINDCRAQHGSDCTSGMAGDVPPTPHAYFTPPTTASFPTATRPGEGSSPRDAISPSVLRNTSSTPNLLTHFLNTEATSIPHAAGPHNTTAEATSTSDLRTLTAQDVLKYRSLRRSSTSSSDDAVDTASSPSSSRAPSTCTSAATELTPPALTGLKRKEDADVHGNYPSSGYTSQQVSPSYVFDVDSQRSPSSWATRVELATNATAARVSLATENGCVRQLRYVKLPWTHDETDLASAHGGFAQGCALIAEALGIDPRFWYAAKIAEDREICAVLQDDASLEHVQTSPSPGKILVHCQCGVSRSATLVIAFVMQAAAMRYGFEAARSLLGMHDCYNMVKEKSSSISPNISLIYQLVEWERHLSSAAGRLRDVLGMTCNSSDNEAGADANTHCPSALVGAGWSTETMDEAMWSKMRLEEEEKEAAEEASRREERLNEATRLVAERKAAQDQLEGRAPEVAIGSEAGVGSLMQRRRKKAAPALQLHAVASAANTSAVPAAASVLSPGFNRRRPPVLQLSAAAEAGASSQGRLEVETPFQSAKMEAWTQHVHDGDGDVMMTEVEPPQTPLRTSVADLDVVSTPTARTAAAATVYTPDAAGSALRTPCEWTSTTAPGDRGHDRMRPSSTSHLPPPSETRPMGRASIDGSMPTTLLSPPSGTLSSPMSASLSLDPRPNHRFSLGGPPTRGSSTARLEADSERKGRTRARPDSMQSTMSSSSSSTALFGVTALSREERKKQHRRTFSSDWPTLQANLASQRRKSKVDGSGLPPVAPKASSGGPTIASAGYAHHDVKDV